MHLEQSILGKLGLGGKYTHYIVEESLVEPATNLIRSLTDEFDIHVEVVEEVDRLIFEFEMQVYSREIGRQVSEIIEERDEDIEVTGFEPEEIVREDAGGPEMYSPEHEYELIGEGKVSGPFSETLSFYYRLKDYEQVHLTELSLQVKE